MPKFRRTARIHHVAISLVCRGTALKAAEMVGVPRLSVVNVVGSAIARETKVGVYLNAGRETAVASTKAFTTQVRRGTTAVDRNMYMGACG